MPNMQHYLERLREFSPSPDEPRRVRDPETALKLWLRLPARLRVYDKSVFPPDDRLTVPDLDAESDAEPDPEAPVGVRRSSRPKVRPDVHPRVLEILRRRQQIVDQSGNTPVIKAIILETGVWIEIAKELIKLRFPLNVTCNNGYTALHTAIYQVADPELFKLLIEYGANVNISNCRGSPFHLVIKELYVEAQKEKQNELYRIFCILYDAGADFTVIPKYHERDLTKPEKRDKRTVYDCLFEPRQNVLPHHQMMRDYESAGSDARRAFIAALPDDFRRDWVERELAQRNAAIEKYANAQYDPENDPNEDELLKKKKKKSSKKSTKKSTKKTPRRKTNSSWLKPIKRGKKTVSKPRRSFNVQDSEPGSSNAVEQHVQADQIVDAEQADDTLQGSQQPKQQASAADTLETGSEQQAVLTEVHSDVKPDNETVMEVDHSADQLQDSNQVSQIRLDQPEPVDQLPVPDTLDGDNLVDHPMDLDVTTDQKKEDEPSDDVKFVVETILQDLEQKELNEEIQEARDTATSQGVTMQDEKLVVEEHSTQQQPMEEEVRPVEGLGDVEEPQEQFATLMNVENHEEAAQPVEKEPELPENTESGTPILDDEKDLERPATQQQATEKEATLVDMKNQEEAAKLVDNQLDLPDTANPGGATLDNDQMDLEEPSSQQQATEETEDLVEMEEETKDDHQHCDQHNDSLEMGMEQPGSSQFTQVQNHGLVNVENQVESTQPVENLETQRTADSQDEDLKDDQTDPNETFVSGTNEEEEDERSVHCLQKVVKVLVAEEEPRPEPAEMQEDPENRGVLPQPNLLDAIRYHEQDFDPNFFEALFDSPQSMDIGEEEAEKPLNLPVEVKANDAAPSQPDAPSCQGVGLERDGPEDTWENEMKPVASQLKPVDRAANTIAINLQHGITMTFDSQERVVRVSDQKCDVPKTRRAAIDLVEKLSTVLKQQIKIEMDSTTQGDVDYPPTMPTPSPQMENALLFKRDQTVDVLGDHVGDASDDGYMGPPDVSPERRSSEEKESTVITTSSDEAAEIDGMSEENPMETGEELQESSDDQPEPSEPSQDVKLVVEQILQELAEQQSVKKDLEESATQQQATEHEATLVDRENQVKTAEPIDNQTDLPDTADSGVATLDNDQMDLEEPSFQQQATEETEDPVERAEEAKDDNQHNDSLVMGLEQPRSSQLTQVQNHGLVNVENQVESTQSVENLETQRTAYSQEDDLEDDRFDPEQSATLLQSTKEVEDKEQELRVLEQPQQHEAVSMNVEKQDGEAQSVEKTSEHQETITSERDILEAEQRDSEQPATQQQSPDEVENPLKAVEGVEDKKLRDLETEADYQDLNVEDSETSSSSPEVVSDQEEDAASVDIELNFSQRESTEECSFTIQRQTVAVADLDVPRSSTEDIQPDDWLNSMEASDDDDSEPDEEDDEEEEEDVDVMMRQRMEDVERAQSEARNQVMDDKEKEKEEAAVEEGETEEGDSGSADSAVPTEDIALEIEVVKKGENKEDVSKEVAQKHPPSDLVKEMTNEATVANKEKTSLHSKYLNHYAEGQIGQKVSTSKKRKSETDITKDEAKTQKTTNYGGWEDGRKNHRTDEPANLKEAASMKSDHSHQDSQVRSRRNSHQGLQMSETESSCDSFQNLNLMVSLSKSSVVEHALVTPHIHTEKLKASVPEARPSSINLLQKQNMQECVEPKEKPGASESQTVDNMDITSRCTPLNVNRSRKRSKPMAESSPIDLNFEPVATEKPSADTLPVFNQLQLTSATSKVSEFFENLSQPSILLQERAETDSLNTKNISRSVAPIYTQCPTSVPPQHSPVGLKFEPTPPAKERPASRSEAPTVVERSMDHFIPSNTALHSAVLVDPRVCQNQTLAMKITAPESTEGVSQTPSIPAQERPENNELSVKKIETSYAPVYSQCLSTMPPLVPQTSVAFHIDPTPAKKRRESRPKAPAITVDSMVQQSSRLATTSTGSDMASMYQHTSTFVVNRSMAHFVPQTPTPPTPVDLKFEQIPAKKRRASRCKSKTPATVNHPIHHPTPFHLNPSPHPQNAMLPIPPIGQFGNSAGNIGTMNNEALPPRTSGSWDYTKIVVSAKCALPKYVPPLEESIEIFKNQQKAIAEAEALHALAAKVAAQAAPPENITEQKTFADMTLVNLGMYPPANVHIPDFPFPITNAYTMDPNGNVNPTLDDYFVNEQYIFLLHHPLLSQYDLLTRQYLITNPLTRQRILQMLQTMNRQL